MLKSKEGIVYERYKLSKKQKLTTVKNVSVYSRNGKWHWTIKSVGFDSLDAVLNDALAFCGELEEVESK